MSRKHFFILANVVLTVFLSLGSFDLTADPAATAKVSEAAKPAAKWNADQQKIIAYLEDLFTASKSVNKGGEAQKKARGQIETAMNWERIAIDCLGQKQWNAQPVKNRNQFRDLLHEVIAKTAFTRLDTFWTGAAYQFEKIDIKGKEAQVVARFTVDGETFTLDYYVERNGANWRVFDIGYEGFRYSTNINEQLMDYLKEKGFPSLIERLRKRLEDLNTGKKAAKTEKK